MRIWNSILSWLGIDSVDNGASANANTEMVKDWWLGFIYVNGARRKFFVSLIMLTSWAI
jgi:hypothetical protein